MIFEKTNHVHLVDLDNTKKLLIMFGGIGQEGKKHRNDDGIVIIIIGNVSGRRNPTL